jgi:HK97 gp10 family phage protein
MDEGVSLQLEGFEEFKAKLESLKQAVQGRIRHNALQAGAEVVFYNILRETPRKTGRTAGELKVQIQNKKDGGVATIFFDQEWPWTALFLEKGTKQNFNIFGQKIKSAQARLKRKRLISAGSTEWRIDPEKHKFMARAFAAAAPAALAAMSAQLRVDIEAAATK